MDDFARSSSPTIKNTADIRGPGFDPRRRQNVETFSYDRKDLYTPSGSTSAVYGNPLHSKRSPGVHSPGQNFLLRCGGGGGCVVFLFLG